MSDIKFMSESDYRKDPAISQSSLGYLTVHPKYFRHKEFVKDDSRKDYFVMGGALDTLLTSPARYKELYIEEPNSSPTSEMMLKLCNLYVKHAHYNKVDPDTSFLLAHSNSGYAASGESSVRKKFETADVQNYINFLIQSEGKTVLKKEEANTVKSMYHLLTTSDHCKWLFEKPKKGMEILFQVPIFFKYNEVACKGLLDILVIDHKNKTLQIIDLKTTGKSVFAFRQAFVSFNYYIQAAFYNKGLETFKKEFKDLGDISEYKILNFRFLVQERACYNKPIFYITSDLDLHVGQHGGILRNMDTPIKGFSTLLEELKWHRQTGYWDMSKDIYDSNFQLELNVFQT